MVLHGEKDYRKEDIPQQMCSGNPYSISEDQSSEGRACSIVYGLESVKVDSKLLSIWSDFSRDRNKLGGGGDSYFWYLSVSEYVQENIKESLRLKDGRKAGRRKHWREAGRLGELCRTSRSKEKDCWRQRGMVGWSNLWEGVKAVTLPFLPSPGNYFNGSMLWFELLFVCFVLICITGAVCISATSLDHHHPSYASAIRLLIL